MTTQIPLLVVSDLKKSFTKEKQTIDVLKGVSLSVSENERHIILGKSGSGKSTLINIIAGFEKPTSGQLVWAGRATQKIPEKELNIFRSRFFGFVHQNYHLLPDFSARDNVEMVLRIGGKSKSEAKARVTEVLERVGLGHRQNHFPREMSGGERQRVGIARALAIRPRVIIADEPTGNLDKETGVLITELLFDMQKEEKSALVIVTHDRDMTKHGQTWTLIDGRFVAGG